MASGELVSKLHDPRVNEKKQHRGWSVINPGASSDIFSNNINYELVNRFQKSVLLIVQYQYLKSFSEDFILQNLIFRNGTGTAYKRLRGRQQLQ